jgi:2-dehydro-3-deoxyphosphooctonate aldolase (KDO 8-P synthase)
VNFCYKTSFDKANRTSDSSYRGEGFDEGFYGIQSVQETIGCEVLTDVHEGWQCGATNADILQIPAFLCRQTDLLREAAETGKPINVKKGQFLSPYEAKYIVDKMKSYAANGIMLTERGTTFGYNNLVVDMRSLEIMKQYQYPVIMDCTHAVQAPGAMNGCSGGDREMAKVIARAAVAVGVAGLFMEVHQDPDNAPSDGPNMIRLDDVNSLLSEIIELDHIRKSRLNM